MKDDKSSAAADLIGDKPFPPVPLHDEESRQDFVVTLRTFLGEEVGTRNYELYKNRIEPEFVAAKGRAPETLDEAQTAFTSEPYYQFWSASQRASQEMVWDSVMDTVDRNLDDMRALASRPMQLGSLRLDRDLVVPGYHDVYDIHLQPGGYHTDLSDDDVAAGAIYDLGVPIYGRRRFGDHNEAAGATMANYFVTKFPDAQPSEILDMGCAIGNSTEPWARAYPQAKVSGIDVGAPCLRYGHLRANAMGATLHLSQQNAEHTDFRDGEFDIVASALLFHETSTSATRNIFRETFRILAPGGYMLAFDGFKKGDSEIAQEFLSVWEAFNNNEHFLLGLRELDALQEVRDAGFTNVRFDKTPFLTNFEPAKTTKVGYMSGGSIGEVSILVAQKPLGGGE